MKKIILGFASFFLLFSCTENETITDTSTLEIGGLPIFADKVIQTASFSAGKYVADIADGTNNIEKYEIVSVSATIDGIPYPAEKVSFIYTLPAKVEISFATLATTFGVPLADISYGDKFDVIAKVTTKDGRVFGGVIPATNGTIPKEGAFPNVNPINNTTTDVLNGNFKQALSYSFTVACPSFDQASMYGTYLINDTDWLEYNDRTPSGYTVQCVSGPRPNSLKFVNFTNIGTDLIVDVNPESQTVTSARVGMYNSFYTYGLMSGEGTSGLVFSCIGTVNLKMRYTVAAGTFSGSWDFILTKQ